MSVVFCGVCRAQFGGYDTAEWGYIEEVQEESFIQRLLRGHGTRIFFGLAGLGFLGFLVLMGPGNVFDAWKRSWRVYFCRGIIPGFGIFGGFGGNDR